MMKERPILFSALMVRAILADEKTQTRRVVKPQPDIIDSDGNARKYKPLEVVLNGELVVMHGPPDDPRDARYVDRPIPCPYGMVGDRLWVRETWAWHPDCGGAIYRATDPGWDDNDYGIKWRPSIFMPRWASRLTLEVVSVRVERVQDISAADKEAEGLHENQGYGPAAFESLWNEINGKRGYGWEVNPWVWRVEFKRVGVS